MPHVSRHTPTQKVADEIYTALLLHVTTKGNVKNRTEAFAELLTKTEQVMLAKRLAIISMLGAGFSFEDIQETLRVSPSTVGRIWTAMQKGKFKKITTNLQKSNISGKLLQALATLVTVPYPKRSRWRLLE